MLFISRVAPAEGLLPGGVCLFSQFLFAALLCASLRHSLDALIGPHFLCVEWWPCKPLVRVWIYVLCSHGGHGYKDVH